MSKKLVISLLFWGAGMTSCLNAQIFNKNIQSDTSEVREWLMFKPQIYNYTTQKTSKFRFDVTQLPFFCKIEHKIESKSKIPFRFRIGDLNYVNMLENKK